MDPRTIAVIILLVAFAAFAVAYAVVGPRRRGPRPSGDIPLAMRPYFSDDELEKSALERAMAWGVALTLFMAVFLPVYWLLEPRRIGEERDTFHERDVEFGHHEFETACVSCHGVDGVGGVAPHPDPEIEAPWPAPALNNIVARYRDDPKVVDIRQFMIQTIKQGRPGTPMPTWGAFYGGGMNDYQIEAIVTYLLDLQVDEVEEPQAFAGKDGREIFDANCVRCHGEKAEGDVGPSLTGVFARFGADGTEDGDAEAAEAVRHTIENGRLVPGGTNMPGFRVEDRPTLTEDAIDRVMEFLRSIQTEESA